MNPTLGSTLQVLASGILWCPISQDKVSASEDVVSVSEQVLSKFGFSVEFL